MRPCIRLFLVSCALSALAGAARPAPVLWGLDVGAAPGLVHQAAGRPDDRGAGWTRAPRADQIASTVRDNSGGNIPGAFQDIPAIPLPGSLSLLLGGLGVTVTLGARQRRKERQADLQGRTRGNAVSPE